MGLKDELVLATDPPQEEEEECEEEVEDPQEVLKEECKELPVCIGLKNELDMCNERVTSRENTAETCEQELYDYFHAVDACVAKSLFKHLK